MIFDNFENDEDAFAPAPRSLPDSSDRDSIEERLAEKKRRVRARDFSCLYHTYKVEVNRLEGELSGHRRPQDSERHSVVSVSIGRRSAGRSSFGHRRFMETHVREDLDSDSSDSHSDSQTCQSNKEQAFEASKTSERVGSLCKAREAIEESKERRSVCRQTEEPESRQLQRVRFRSYQHFESGVGAQATRKASSLQAILFRKRVSNSRYLETKIPSFASLEQLEKTPFGVTELTENCCLQCGQAFKFGQLIAELTNCLHKFHKQCIDSVLESRNCEEGLRCPVCDCLL